MKQYSDLEFLALSKLDQEIYKILRFLISIPLGIWHKIVKLGQFFKKLGIAIKDDVVDLIETFKNGDYKTRVSYLIMGFGSALRGQVLRGIFFFAFEAFFIFYMINYGSYWLSMLPSLGKQGPQNVYNEIFEVYTYTYFDNSFKILLYGVLTIFFIIAFIYTWRLNIRQNRIAQSILDSGKKLKSGKDDIKSLVDDQFHKTLLALPVLGITTFTVIPLFFMILVAFTNYDGTHDGYVTNLFTWVGWENFNTLLSWSNGTNSYAATFGEILSWTLIWAFFATFTNYFLGMFVAMMINKKGIKLKKFWRTVLVLTIAIPQFISLLYVSKMFDKTGIINGELLKIGAALNDGKFLNAPLSKIGEWLFDDPTKFWIVGRTEPIDFWGDPSHPWRARACVILINIWIGIPYLMLMATGILMNIPQDLYESAKIDGASGIQQFGKITLPYMLFVTGPYLLTSFTGNMNNFNVIYLLTGGGPTNSKASSAAGSVGYTDLLITWLFKITTGAESKYYMASVIGIMVFVIAAVIVLLVYNVLPSNRNEEDMQ